MPVRRSKEPVIACIDPRGHTPERPKIPLKAPRPTTLKDKNVIVMMRESFPNLMPAVRDELLKEVPSVKVSWWDYDKQGPLTAAQAIKLKPDAAIIGVAY